MITGKGISIYCDESSHLENDKNVVMGLGALYCDTDMKDVIFKKLREIKIRHGLKRDFEVKWTKVSNSKFAFYEEIVELFFNTPYLGFRSVIINKNNLDHHNNGSSHDDFYYKMNFLLLRQLLEPSNEYRIYLDKKDTNGRKKIAKLHDFLCSNQFDYKKEIVKSVQEVVSDQVELVQLCDLLLGAVCYANRGLESSEGKLKIVEKIRTLSGYSLIKNTFPSEQKMNTLIWVGNKNNNSDG